jgi:signal transduction histidine kinase
VRLPVTSLRNRLVLLFTLGTALTLVAGFLVLYATLAAALRDAVDDGLAARVGDIASALRADDLSPLTRDPFAELLDRRGVAVATSATFRSAAGEPEADVRGLPAVSDEVLSAARAHRVYVTTSVAGEDSDVRLVAEPVRGKVLLVGASLAEADRAQVRFALLLTAAAGLLLLALALAGWLLAGAALRPVAALTDQAAVISSLDAPGGLPVPPGNDELARLARTLNTMLRRLAVSFERERAFVDDASHELRTPVSVIRGELELALLAEDDPAEVTRSLRNALAEVDRLGGLAEDLLVLARERAGNLAAQRVPVDMRELACRTLARLREGSAVQMQVVGNPAVGRGDELLLERVLINLVGNAAAAGASRVQVAVFHADQECGWRVSDDGPGIPAQLLPTIFERFVRGNTARTRHAGAGLGLAIVAAIVRSHRGTVRADNGGEYGGAVFEIRLPRA